MDNYKYALAIDEAHRQEKLTQGILTEVLEKCAAAGPHAYLIEARRRESSGDPTAASVAP